VVNNLVDGQTHSIVVDIEAAGQLSVAMVELVKLTAKSLGFPRASGPVAEHLSAAVVLLVKRGRAQRDGDKVVLA